MSVEIEQIVDGSVTFQEALRLQNRFESITPLAGPTVIFFMNQPYFL
jgi:hypothetical protein